MDDDNVSEASTIEPTENGGFENDSENELDNSSVISYSDSDSDEIVIIPDISLSGLVELGNIDNALYNATTTRYTGSYPSYRNFEKVTINKDRNTPNKKCNNRKVRETKAEKKKRHMKYEK